MTFDKDTIAPFVTDYTCVHPFVSILFPVLHVIDFSFQSWNKQQ